MLTTLHYAFAGVVLLLVLASAITAVLIRLHPARWSFTSWC